MVRCPALMKKMQFATRTLAVLAVCVPGGQCAHEVIGWRCGALVEKPGEVGEHLLGGVVGGLDRAAVGITLASEAAVQDGQRLTEPVPVRERDAEHIVDHGERQRQGKAGDQVHAARGGRPVDQRSGTLGDDRPVAPNPAGGEQAAERIPDTAVPVALQPDHPPPEQLECRVRGRRDGGAPRNADRAAPAPYERVTGSRAAESRARSPSGSARPGGRNSAPSSSNSVSATVGRPGGIAMWCILPPTRPGLARDGGKGPAEEPVEGDGGVSRPQRVDGRIGGGEGGRSRGARRRVWGWPPGCRPASPSRARPRARCRCRSGSRLPMIQKPRPLASGSAERRAGEPGRSFPVNVTLPCRSCRIWVADRAGIEPGA